LYRALFSALNAIILAAAQGSRFAASQHPSAEPNQMSTSAMKETNDPCLSSGILIADFVAPDVVAEP